MNSARFPSETDVVVTRVTDNQWQAVANDRVVADGDATTRPDGRVFLSIDSWHEEVFDLLATRMLADLPSPLYTVVDEADGDLTARWQRAGFTIRRREWEYLLPTAAAVSSPPGGVTILAAGESEEHLLRELDGVIRAEVEATVGWQQMPAEILPRPAIHPSKYAVATSSGRYVGLVRVAAATRQPRIGLIAVKAEHQRRGIARALLGHVLDSLRRSGIESAWVEVNESNDAAIALFDGAGAQRVSSNIELVRH
ncbi:GNAT family N-acetyltransferase [Actinosynnema sp. ALI-1.44]|uniref:GNAT family N-acetyltransferase n=1 Tax=Actinosynnema sp. ALI-1.44 TaxID=1933779 RepID=UPI00097C1A11|nr:GNAT family N-acetyltransferase [Actinosynnema sp. ALI-1.44]ONI83137.1 GNAT family N-acetyltransferase [Actinosynnema sp. ALI-1.44]